MCMPLIVKVTRGHQTPPGTGITDDFESPHMCWDLNSGPQVTSPATVQGSFKPHNHDFWVEPLGKSDNCVLLVTEVYDQSQTKRNHQINPSDVIRELRT